MIIKDDFSMKAGFLSKKQKKDLKRQFEIEKNNNRIQSDRIRIILLLDSGWSQNKVAEAFMIDRKSVYNCFKRYKEYGIEGLLNDCHRGREPFLSTDQKDDLIEDLKSKLFRSVMEIIHHVKEKFNVEYSLSGMKYMLHCLNFSFKKPKGVPAKANEVTQRKYARYLKYLITLMSGKKSGKERMGRVFFADAVHPTHGTALQYGWIKKGQEFWLKTPGGRFRVNLHGVVCAETLDIMVREYETINRFSICQFLKELRAKYPKGKICFVCDCASYYTANDTKKTAKDLGIRLIFLPSYSPNLNIIERLWKFMRKKVLSWYHETHEGFRAAIKKFFHYIRKYKNDLKTLLSLNFQILDSSLAK